METRVAEAVRRATGRRAVMWKAGGRGGHTGAPKWLVELEGCVRAFVKAGASEEEQAVYAEVSGSFLPRLYGTADGVLVLEDLSDGDWPPPYPGDVRPLFAALDEIGATIPPEQLPPLRGPRYWELVRGDPAPFLALGLVSAEWLDASIETLVAVESRAELAGDALVHGDVWAGNVCFTARGAVLVDWGDARRGNPEFDVALAAFSVRNNGASPPELAFDLAPWIALLTGQWAVGAPKPLPDWIRPDSTLREAQRRELAGALAWAAEALGLPPPR